MITTKDTKVEKRIEIDLTGPEGNVFYLIGVAIQPGKKLGFDIKAIVEDMTSSDYEHTVQVIEKHFGDFIIMYR